MGMSLRKECEFGLFVVVVVVLVDVAITVSHHCVLIIFILSTDFTSEHGTGCKVIIVSERFDVAHISCLLSS